MGGSPEGIRPLPSPWHAEERADPSGRGRAGSCVPSECGPRLPPGSSQRPRTQVGPGQGGQFLTPLNRIRAPPWPPPAPAGRWRNFPVHRCCWAGPQAGSEGRLVEAPSVGLARLLSDAQEGVCWFGELTGAQPTARGRPSPPEPPRPRVTGKETPVGCNNQRRSGAGAGGGGVYSKNWRICVGTVASSQATNDEAEAQRGGVPCLRLPSLRREVESQASH